MQSLLPAVVTLVTLVFANPVFEARGVYNADNCARLITGTAAGQPLATRQADCSAFMTAPSPAVPAYASACSGTSRYSSACSYFGITTPTTTCISSTQATSIVNTFASLLTAPQAPDFISTANALLADDFKDTSGSINLLAGQDLSSVTFPSKAAFIAGQGAQPPIPTVTTLEIIFTCSKIAWRWVAQGIGSGQFEVKGINVFTITAAGQISEVFTEFNSGAWLGDIGNPQCPSSATS